MLKWILGCAVVIAVAVAAVVYSPSYLLISNPGKKASEGEIVVDDKMRQFCKGFFKDDASALTKAQYDAACKCFATEMFGTGQDGSSADAAAAQKKVDGGTQSSMEQCVNQARAN